MADEHLAPGFLGYLEYPFLWLRDFCLHPVNALPYHIYVVSSKIPQNAYTERVQYGTAFVFLAVVMVIAHGLGRPAHTVAAPLEMVNKTPML